MAKLYYCPTCKKIVAASFLDSTVCKVCKNQLYTDNYLDGNNWKQLDEAAQEKLRQRFEDIYLEESAKKEELARQQAEREQELARQKEEEQQRIAAERAEADARRRKYLESLNPEYQYEIWESKVKDAAWNPDYIQQVINAYAEEFWHVKEIITHNYQLDLTTHTFLAGEFGADLATHQQIMIVFERRIR